MFLPHSRFRRKKEISDNSANSISISLDLFQCLEGTAQKYKLIIWKAFGCFMSNLLAAAKSRDAEVSEVTLNISGTVESAPSRFSAVHMSIAAHGTDQELMEKLVTIAERGCIVANTLRGSVDLSITLA